MSINNDEHRIREFAYQIWESEGKPDGHGERHWDMACKLAAAQGPDENAPAADTDSSATRGIDTSENARNVIDQLDNKPEKKPRAKKATVKSDTVKSNEVQLTAGDVNSDVDNVTSIQAKIKSKSPKKTKVGTDIPA